MSDDVETMEALAIVHAHASGGRDVLAALLAEMGAPELRRVVNRMAALVDLRGTVGTDQPTTAAWVAWLRSMDGLVL